ncbi:MAG: adenylate/guanylate cyclase domain-containing protein [Gordonia sp. (in: high G+C Gram-positive bacteria)]|uniref:adenylate/guanylate cyclase domain-containing protein n=1 Tax=Gordonia sp. (in: high G+C Gram-positive bacteria) TaxID=84139 RepID=UPI0039E589DC
MEKNAPREFFHRSLNRLDRLKPLQAAHGELHADQPELAWADLDDDERRRLVRRGSVIGALMGVFAKVLIALETVVLVLLTFTGGRLTLDLPRGRLHLVDLLIGVLVGSVISIVLSQIVMRSYFRWFIAGAPPQPGQRRRVAALPWRQALCDTAGWVCGFGIYALISGVWNHYVIAAAGATALAAVTSGCLSYLFAEAAARPLAVLALDGEPEPVVLHGVRERMLVVWTVGAAVPMVGLLAINAGRWANWLPPADGRVDWAVVFLAFLTLASGLQVVSLVGRAIADPLTEMREVVEAATDGDLDRRVDVYDTSEIGVLQVGLNDMLDGLTERERIREVFSRHVGDEVAQLAMEHDGQMFGANVDVAVVFVDITGSTAFAEQRDPQETAVVLNAFFSIVDDVVSRYGGLINKFEGDAALVVFGAPTPLDDPAGQALAAARELGEDLSENIPIEWGMGVGYGQVFAGNIGSATRYEYTVIGDPVNEAARLSEQAKDGVSRVYASSDAVDAAVAADSGEGGEGEFWQPAETRTLRGRTEPTRIFAPTTLPIRSEPPTLGSVLAELVRLPGRRAREMAEQGRLTRQQGLKSLWTDAKSIPDVDEAVPDDATLDDDALAAPDD